MHALPLLDPSSTSLCRSSSDHRFHVRHNRFLLGLHNTSKNLAAYASTMAGVRRAAASQPSSAGRSMRRSLLLPGSGTNNGDGEGDSRRYGDSATMRRLGTSDTLDAEASEMDPLLSAEAGHGGVHAGRGSALCSRHIDSSAADLPHRCAQESVFPLLQTVRNDVRATIDTHLDWVELTSLDVNYAVVRPLALKYSRINQEQQDGQRRPGQFGQCNLSILFVFLVNRVQFQRDAERDLALQNVNNTRAALCELLAMKLLRTFARDGLQLITALTYPFSAFQGADEATLSREGLLDKDSGQSSFGPGQCTSALELAISSRAKKFIKTPLCQRCVAGIYDGRVVVSYQATHAIVDDSYKKRPLGIYDPATAPFLDHHRLRVPLIRNRIEFCNFGILLLLYVWCLSKKTSPTWTWAETLFTIWLCGFALDEVTQMQEHGIGMYIGSLYNMLDAMFCVISFIWFGIRMSGLANGDLQRSALSFETLAIGAILLCPRVASVLVQDNVILLALKAMLSDFCFFMALAAVCFSGFLYTFWALSGPEWSAGKILWIMIKVWFGNSYVGFDTAQSLSPIFGPPLMVLFAIMANTLLLTILISLLSNTFSIVAQNAVEEAMYQFACKTVSGISSEALISYAPPLNLVALVVMVPASFFLSPRYLHKANVYLLRLTSWPILLVIRFASHHWPTGKHSTSSYLFNSSSAERAGHLISWIPLPRSRSNPDRDMIQAAFMRSAALSNDHQNGHSASSRERTSENDWEEQEWNASMFHVPAQARSETAEETHARPASQPVDYGATKQPETPGKKAWTDNTALRVRESPLARLFGRAFRGLPESDDSTSRRTTSRPTPRSTSRKASDDKTATLIDVDAATADQTGATNDDGQHHAGQPTQLPHDDDTDAPGSSTHEGGLEEQASMLAVVRALADRIDAQDRVQKRIEGLLQQIVDKQADAAPS